MHHAEMRFAQLFREPRTTHEATWRVRLRILRHYRVELSDLGVTPTQAGILLYLHRYPGTYRQSVADALGIDAAWTGTVIRVLHQKGWLKKQRAPCDDSYVLLTVTRKGTDFVNKITRRLTPAPWRNGCHVGGSTSERRSACP